VHFGIEAFQWCIPVRAMLWGVNVMLGLCWLPQQPCNASGDVSTPVFDWALVIFIPFHVFKSV